jgi:hypothetical protein
MKETLNNQISLVPEYRFSGSGKQGYAFKIFFIFLIFLTVLSCKKSSPELPLPGQINISRVEGPTSGKKNETLYLTVYYPTSSSCDVFDRLEKNTNGKIVSVRAFGHTDTSTNCLEVAVDKSASLSFTPTTTGVYELRFINIDNSWFAFKISIN